MRLENIVWNARDPHRLGSFWAAALGAGVTATGAGGLEAQVALSDGAFLDLCFQPVDEPPSTPPHRGAGVIHLDVRPLPDDPDAVALVRRMGGRTLDWPGAAGRPWTVCADPSGNDFCVLAPA
jgi:hypothetical protein